MLDPEKSKQITDGTQNIKCGVINPGGLIFRFMDESYADFGEFPWVVAIIKKTNSTSTVWSQKDYVAGGTLIHPSVVVSAARGFVNKKPDEFKIRAGEWDNSLDDESYTFQERDVRKIVIHPEFFKESLYNDVSLLFLAKPYDLVSAPHIGPACVGQTIPEAGTKCFGTGWGLGAKTTITSIMKKLPITLISREECETKMKNTRLGDIFKLHESFTCGGSTDDSCKGDEGAPLVCAMEGQSTRYILYGISAYRINQKGSPCVYANVPQFYKWIGERMSEEGFNSKTYTYRP
ncbi:phenoloxidase-activating factor 2-like [Battus philenor]|uniref:phenoloxidase-activating factor 2-like n=1 Tax=Battus philenor TaxID=42288 RepID=UPI0035D00758